MYILVCDKCNTKLNTDEHYTLNITKYFTDKYQSDQGTVHLCKKCYKNLLKDIRSEIK